MKTIKFFKRLAALLGFLGRPILKAAAASPAALLELVYGRATIAQPTCANHSPVVKQRETVAKPAEAAKAVAVPAPVVVATDVAGSAARAPVVVAVSVSTGLGVSERVRTCTVMSGGLTMGAIWVYLYPDRGIARRVFKILNKELARALGWERYYYPDVPYDPAEGTETIMDALRAEVARQLDTRKQGQKGKHHKVDNKTDAAPAAVVESVNQKQRPAAPTRAADASSGMHPEAVHAKQSREQGGTREKAQAQAPVVFPPTVPEIVMPASKRRVEGQCYEGVVTQAGRTQRTGSKGRYETFCLTLHDGKKEIPLFGAELERQSTDMGLRPGEKVSVIYMGVQKIGTGEDAYTKNLYQIQRTHNA